MFNEPMSSRVSRSRVSFNQLQALVTYLESHPLLAKGEIGCSTEARSQSKLGWDTVATILNAFDDGVTKSGCKWSHYWSSYKNKFKAKLRRAADPGEGDVRLTRLEQRVKTLLGPAFARRYGRSHNLRVELDPDVPEQELGDFAIDVVVNKVDYDELPTEDAISSLSGASNEEPAYATVNVIASNDNYDMNSQEVQSKTYEVSPESGLLRLEPPAPARVSTLRPAPAHSRYRQMNGGHQSKLQGVRIHNNRIYERTIHKRTLKHMNEKRREERELFELKKKKLLLEIKALENKLLNSFCVFYIFFP